MTSLPPSPISTTIDYDADGVQHGHLVLPYSRDDAAYGSIMIPIAVIKNGDGPTALLSGGNHGDEYQGPLSLLKLANTLDPADVTGRVIIVPTMNQPAFAAARRTSPIDDGMILGPVRGGMGVAVVIVGTLLAAATGVVAATVIVMGVLSLPVMVKYRYDHQLASGVIVASGTLAQLMPPSLVLIVLAQFIPVSVGQLFAGALIPGIILATMFALYVLLVAYMKPGSAPAIPKEERNVGGGELLKQFLLAVVPPLGLILAVLGSIFRGLATASEAGAVGAFGAIMLALIYRRLSIKVLWEAARATSNITSLVLQILLASTFFALVFQRLGGQDRITEWLQNVPGGLWGFIIAAHIIVFILGINLEFLEISFIVMPLFIPAAIALDVNLVWFAVLMAVNLNMAFISPPVGFSPFYLQSVAPPEVKTAEIHRGAIPFMVVQAVGLVILTILPESVVYLVTASGLGNEATNNTDFIPGSFGLRLALCVAGTALLAVLWGTYLRKRHGDGLGPGRVGAAIT